MKKIFLIILLITFSIISFGCGNTPTNNTNKTTTNDKENYMNLISANFKNGEILPSKYTCNGNGVAPKLSWSDYPSETKSFALTLEDPDAPTGTFMHWIIVNIPVNITSVPEGTVSLTDATMIANDGGKSDYVSPCPPSGIHRYIFKIFALDSEKIDGIDKNNFYNKINPYIIAQAELESKYGK